jgi:N6-adenosine-specific RNA methylase IME4
MAGDAVTTQLVRYDAACAALDAAVKADEVMHVRLEAKAIAAVARVAKNLDLEIKAARLRTRAEARLGEMLEQGERAGIVARHGGRRPQEQDSVAETCRPATLKEIGVEPKLSSQARKLSGIGAPAVAAMLDRMERESRERGRLAVNVIGETLAKRNAETRRSLARELSDTAALSPAGRMFAVLYADPPWRRKAGIGNRAYENHYVTMTWEELLAMPVANRLLPDAWGFIWIPRAHLLALIEVEADTSLGRGKVKMPLAWAIASAWGFDSYSTCTVWTKTDEEFPEDQGTGLVFYDQDELLLVFKRGRGLPKPDTDKKHGSNHRERAGKHSAKPSYYRDMINDMTGGVPVLELFAREDDDNPLPPNFFTWGNESKNTAERPEPADSSGNALPHDADGVITPSESVAETCKGDSAVAAAPETPAALGLNRPASAAGELSCIEPTHQSDGVDLDVIPKFLRRPSDNSPRPVSVASPRVDLQSIDAGDGG